MKFLKSILLTALIVTIASCTGKNETDVKTPDTAKGTAVKVADTTKKDVTAASATVKATADKTVDATKKDVAPILKKSEITINKVVQAADKAGIKYVKTIDFVDGKWILETQFKTTETKYLYDIKSSKLSQIATETDQDPLPPKDMTSIINAINTVEALKNKTYAVLKIEAEGTFWKVKALDNEGLKHEVLVNTESSKIIHANKDN